MKEELKKITYSSDIVIPCYFEEEALPVSIPLIIEFFKNIVENNEVGLSEFKIILIDDGSKDRTWDIISEFSKHNQEVSGIRLARNYGHQAAMLAGLSEAEADVTITMDADLQDDIEAVAEMLSAYEAGSDLALGVRNDRSSDTWFKRETANAYYRTLSLFGVNVIENHADFRLMSRRAREALLEHKEVNLFLRGLIPTLGFRATLVPYVRKPRQQGETKYTLRKMIRLAADGITSFSIAPLRMIAMLGAVVFAASILLGIYFLIERIFYSETVTPGWASTVLPILFLGGMQIFSIGILGEYVGKIYLEVKNRPRFIIQEKI